MNEPISAKELIHLLHRTRNRLTYLLCALHRMAAEYGIWNRVNRSARTETFVTDDGIYGLRIKSTQYPATPPGDYYLHVEIILRADQTQWLVRPHVEVYDEETTQVEILGKFEELQAQDFMSLQEALDESVRQLMYLDEIPNRIFDKKDASLRVQELLSDVEDFEYDANSFLIESWNYDRNNKWNFRER